MKTRIRISILLCVLLFISTLTGCSTYKAGKIKDGVYTNTRLGVKITPSGDMKYLEDPMESMDYAVNLSYTYLNGGKDSFLAEYALDSRNAGLMVVSEDNVKGFTADDFVTNIEDQLKEKLFFTYKTETNENVTIANTTFRKFVIDSDDNKQVFLIKVMDDKIIYIYISATRNAIKNCVLDEYYATITPIE